MYIESKFIWTRYYFSPKLLKLVLYYDILSIYVVYTSK